MSLPCIIYHWIFSFTSLLGVKGIVMTVAHLLSSRLTYWSLVWRCMRSSFLRTCGLCTRNWWISFIWWNPALAYRCTSAVRFFLISQAVRRALILLSFPRSEGVSSQCASQSNQLHQRKPSSRKKLCAQHNGGRSACGVTPRVRSSFRVWVGNLCFSSG